VNWPEPIGLSPAASSIAALVLAFACASLLSLTLTPPVRDAARRRGWVDRPDGRRKLHAAAVPRLGGVAVLLAFACAFGLSLAVLRRFGWSDPGHVQAALHLMLATALVASIGLLDDILGVGPWVKLLGQVTAGLWLFGHGYDVQLVSNPFGPPVALGWLSLPLTVSWIVVISNAFNLIDGLDGLAAGVALFATGVLFTFALLNEQWEIALMAAALAGALLGFLRYNFSPATVFLGDGGSLSVGLVLAALSLRGSTKSSMAVALVTPLLALGFPLLDTALALLRRLLVGRSILQADADHIHHRMLRMGMTPRRVVVMLYGMTALFGAMALLTMSGRKQAELFALVTCSAFTWLGIRWLGNGPPAGSRDPLLDALRARLRTAADASEAWEMLVQTAAVLRLQGLALRVQDGPLPTRTWGENGESAGPALPTFTLPLSDRHGRVGELIVTPAVGDARPGVRALLQELGPELGQALGRGRPAARGV
jgi:UDP-GlcNAc:undecaprenyl-phosphate GlcNAc-1-phosphate transferase